MESAIQDFLIFIKETQNVLDLFKSATQNMVQTPKVRPTSLIVSNELSSSVNDKLNKFTLYMNIRAYFSALQPECILFLQKAKMNSLYCISFFLIAVQFSALNGAPQRGLSWSGVPMSVFVEKNDPRKYPANVTL